MAKIKVNLLGKKKTEVPFGLGETFQKLGIKTDDLGALRPGLIKIAVLLAGLYVADYFPTYFFELKKAELAQKVEALEQHSNVLKKELTQKKGIREQMDQLNREEIELQRQLTAVANLKADRSLAFRSLDALINTVPDTIWLGKINYSNRKFDLDGSSWDYFAINDFVKSITESTRYLDVKFRGIQTKPPGEPYPGIPESVKAIKTFTLEYFVKDSGGQGSG